MLLNKKQIAALLLQSRKMNCEFLLFSLMHRSFGFDDAFDDGHLHSPLQLERYPMCAVKKNNLRTHSHFQISNENLKANIWFYFG